MTPKTVRLRLERLKLMRRRKAKKVQTTHPVPVDAQNLCKKPNAPGQLLVSDFTYIALPKGFAYLAVTVDVFSRRVKGYALSSRMKTDLVTKALEMAAQSGRLEPGWIHHSDRGCQYASTEFRNLVQRLGGVSSFSKPASPQDNAYAESFFARFKDEEVKANDYQSFNEVQIAVQNYIQDYNAVRKHSSIGKTSPCQYEEDFRKKDSKNKSVSI